jgi:hypothetical protein
LRLHYSAEELTDIISWYCNHYADQFTPKAHSAEQFVAKFPNIVQAKLNADLAVKGLRQCVEDDVEEVVEQVDLGNGRFQNRVVRKVTPRVVLKQRTKADNGAVFYQEVRPHTEADFYQSDEAWKDEN